MQVFDIFGAETLNDEATATNKQPSGNVYIREVVYIEVNQIEAFKEFIFCFCFKSVSQFAIIQIFDIRSYDL